MKFDQIQFEEAAYDSVREVLAAARKCQELHERAGLSLPHRIQRMLGLISESSGSTPSGMSSRVPKPERGNVPSGAEPDWISIPLTDGIVATLTLALLRANGPMKSKDVQDRIVDLKPETKPGSVANVGTRFKANATIMSTPDGWQLLKPESAAIIHEGKLWGPAVVFTPPELATYRREAILHILKYFASGLQVVQIVQEINSCDWWTSGTVNKDMLKADLPILAELGKLIQVGQSRKWKLAPIEKTQ